MGGIIRFQSRAAREPHENRGMSFQSALFGRESIRWKFLNCITKRKQPHIAILDHGQLIPELGQRLLAGRQRRLGRIAVVSARETAG